MSQDVARFRAPHGHMSMTGDTMRVFHALVACRQLRRLFAFTAVLFLALATAGCLDNEPQQRRAFITFLQTRIIDKPGLHIPVLSDKDIADLGPYADHYRVMNGFHHNVDASISKDLATAMQFGTPRSLEDLRNHREILPVLRSAMSKMKDDLDRAQAEADAKHKALRQPPDLKAVYDIAYDRMVTKPAAVFSEIVPVITGFLPSIDELATYLDEHRDTITFRAGAPVVTDPAVREKLATLMQAAGTAADAADEGKRKLRAMVEGK
jgi:DUF3053 family protein